MNSMENPVVNEVGSNSAKDIVADKEELVVAFSQLSDEAKAQFYEDCKNGISPEEVRQAMHQKIKQLWGK